MTLQGTDPEAYIPEYTLVHEDKIFYGGPSSLDLGYRGRVSRLEGDPEVAAGAVEPLFGRVLLQHERDRLRAQSRSDLYWHSPESGDVQYKSRQMKKSI